MLIDFELLPPHSRVWIYQSDRELTEKEQVEILAEAGSFVKEWTAHGNNLKAGTTLLHDRFLILSVDEKISGTSGCSIDASVRFIRSLEKEYALNFLDRSNIAYILNGEIRMLDLQSLKQEIEDHKIDGDTLIFNNLVERKEDLGTRWLSRADDTWVKRYFKRLT